MNPIYSLRPQETLFGRQKEESGSHSSFARLLGQENIAIYIVLAWIDLVDSMLNLVIDEQIAY